MSSKIYLDVCIFQGDILLDFFLLEEGRDFAGQAGSVKRSLGPQAAPAEGRGVQQEPSRLWCSGPGG